MHLVAQMMHWHARIQCMIGLAPAISGHALHSNMDMLPADILDIMPVCDTVNPDSPSISQLLVPLKVT
jgi:hypothetical protein